MPGDEGAPRKSDIVTNGSRRTGEKLVTREPGHHSIRSLGNFSRWEAGKAAGDRRIGRQANSRRNRVR